MWVDGQRHVPAALPTGKKLGAHCKGGLVGARAGLDRCGKFRPPPGFDHRTVQPVASRYTDWVIPAHLWHSCLTFCLSAGSIRVVGFLMGNYLASEIQTPGNYPEGSIRHSEHGESLKSSIRVASALRKALLWSASNPVGVICNLAASSDLNASKMLVSIQFVRRQAAICACRNAEGFVQPLLW